MSDNVLSAANQQERLLIRQKIMNPNYIVGLVDGEGYFSVSIDRRKYPTYITREVNMVFGIDLKESDGRILKKVQQYFKCGNLNRKIDKRENFCDQTMYQVRSHQHINGIIIPFFKRYPFRFPSRQKKFKYFVEIGEIVKNREHLKSEGFKKVEKLVKRMRQ